MKITRRQFLIASAALPAAAWAAPYTRPALETSTWLGEWRDAKRDRTIPVKIYFPQGDGPFPVIIFSHGLGGSREGYSYLGNQWGANGYVSVHLQHIGSDDSVWKGGGGMQNMARAANAKNATDRARDVSFALDQLEKLNAAGDFPLRGKLDLKKIGMAGHSFGSNTTLLVCGMKFDLPGAPDFSDPRIKAAIAMSAPSPQSKNYEKIYGTIKLPMFHMTGTKDESPLDRPGSSAADRRTPYDQIKGTDSYLTVFKDGDHMVFSGARRGARVPSDARNHELIQQSSTAFWDAYLRGDAKAKGWLADEFGKELGTAGTFEKKVAPTAVVIGQRDLTFR